MTDSEIIKALECCINCDCKNCPCKVDESHCDEIPTEEILDLINRLKADIEALINGQETLQKNLPKAIKSEAYKEFVERLLQKKYQSSDWSHGEHPFVVELDDILDTIEEMG